jgi:hypothetical protein
MFQTTNQLYMKYWSDRKTLLFHTMLMDTSESNEKY